MGGRHSRWGGALCALVGTLGLAAMEHAVVGERRDGLYFKRGKSDDLWQCLDGEVLRREPLRALWYLHKEPPGVDALRAAAACLHQDVSDAELPRALDGTLFVVWMLLYGAVAWRLASWMWQLGGGGWGAAVALVWALHPSAILYATILDGTLLGALALLVVGYELWRAARMPSAASSAVRVALATLLAFVAKNTFQWYFVPLVAAALVLLGVPRRRLLLFAAIAGPPVAGYLVKQTVLFGTTATTSFAGDHYCGFMWYRPTGSELAGIQKELGYRYPDGARIHDRDSHNTERQCRANQNAAVAARRFMLREPGAALRGVFRSVRLNWEGFRRPSSRYASGGGHPIIDRLPWTEAYERILAGPIWMTLLGAAAAGWLLRTARREGPAGLRRGVACTLPFAYATALCFASNRYEWSEAVRQRFLLEPVALVFLAMESRQSFVALSAALGEARLRRLTAALARGSETGEPHGT